MLKYLFITLLGVFIASSDTSEDVFHRDTPKDPFLEILNLPPNVGDVIDSYNGVNVYYNGEEGNVFGRNMTADNYNLGLKYQCVEFVKRFYFIHYGHRMRDTYGHAKELFDENLPDRKLNHDRGLYQFINGSEYRPIPGDLVVFDGNYRNPYGHAGIVTVSVGNKMEIIHQNVGMESRELFIVTEINGRFFVVDPDIKGWMRK